MRARTRVAVGLIGMSVAVLPAVTSQAIAGLPNAVIGTGRVQGTTVLVNSSGRTVYVFTGDHGGRSKCYGRCLSGWKPVLTGAKVFARHGSGVNPKLLGITRRTNGQLQVSYDRRPLYTNADDSRRGQDYGQFCPGNTGGYWFIVNKNGTPNKTVIGPNPMCEGY